MVRAAGPALLHQDAFFLSTALLSHWCPSSSALFPGIDSPVADLQVSPRTPLASGLTCLTSQQQRWRK